MIEFTAEERIAIIGLGYVGLPLAVEFGKSSPVLGFDIDAGRVAELQGGHDRTGEVVAEELAAAAGLAFTAAAAELAVAHDTFLKMGAAGIRALGKTGHVLYDIKSVLPRAEVDARL